MRLVSLPALLCLALSLGPWPRLRAQTGPAEDSVITREAEATVELDLLVAGGPVWKMTAGDVESAFKKKGFAWLDESAKTRAIVRPRNLILRTDTQENGVTTHKLKQVRHKLMLFGAPAYEATLEFASDRLA